MGQTGAKIFGESADVYEAFDIYQKKEEIRIILIGKTGTGKSTFGNAILGDGRFENEGVTAHSNTICCQIGHSKRKDGKHIVVLDTPGLMDTKREQVEIFEELCKCTAMTAPGPHAFCLLIRGDDRFTQENISTLNEFCKFFGEEIYKYLIVVFTHKKGMGKDATTDRLLSALPDEFQQKFLRSQGKKFAMECKAPESEIKKQVNEFFKLIDEIIQQNNGGYYSEDKFKKAEEAFRKRIPEIQKLVGKRFEPQIKSLEIEYQEKAKQSEQKQKDIESKLEEEKKKFDHDKQLKDEENAESLIKKLEAKHDERMRLLEEKLEKERKEKNKIKEHFDEQIEKVKCKENEDLRSAIIEDRIKAREQIPECKEFSDIGRRMVQEGAGYAYDVVAGSIGTAIGAIGAVGSAVGRWFWS